MSTNWTASQWATANVTTQIRGAEAISTGVNFSFPSQAIYVGTGGTTFTVTMIDGDSVPFAGVPNGTILYVCATQVSAVTGASGLVALY